MGFSARLRPIATLAAIATLGACSESPIAPSASAPQFAYSGARPAFGAGASGSELATPGGESATSTNASSPSIPQPIRM